jgi:hypothetical protein
MKILYKEFALNREMMVAWTTRLYLDVSVNFVKNPKPEETDVS